MKVEVGSEWIARDGRKFRVLEVIDDPRVTYDPFAHLMLLNKTSKRQRTSTNMSIAKNFSDENFSRFLSPLT